MGIESYGGCCPKCNKSMLNKYESSTLGLMFDACPWCGFAYGTLDSEEITDPAFIWEAIFEHHFVQNREELIQSAQLEEMVPKEKSEFYPSLFVYTFSQKEDIQ